MTDPICATSLAATDRSRRAISEACSVVGTIAGESGSASELSPFTCLSRASKTVLVNSSMKRGTPSACAIILSTTCFGRIRSPVIALIREAACRLSSPFSDWTVTCGRPAQDGCNSGRLVMTSRIGCRSTVSISKFTRSKVVGSAQWISSKTASSGLCRVSPSNCRRIAARVIALLR
jgi:hypothetical protein